MAKKVFKSFIAIFSSFVILVAVVGNGSVSQAVTSSFVETGVKEKITDFSFGLIENYFKKGDEKPSNTNSEVNLLASNSISRSFSVVSSSDNS